MIAEPDPPSDRPISGRRFARVRALALLGAAAPIVYLAALLIGAWLWPEYSAYSESVSTLTSTGAPNQWILVPLFAFYNVGLICLAVGLLLVFDHRWSARLGPIFLATAGAVGLVLFAFPQDPWGAPITSTGFGHIVLAGVIALCFLLALGFTWRAMRADPSWVGFDRFTLVMLVLGVAVGLFGALSVASPYAGLAERASIGVFLLWTEVTAWGLYLRGERSPAAREDRPVAFPQGEPRSV